MSKPDYSPPQGPYEFDDGPWRLCVVCGEVKERRKFVPPTSDKQAKLGMYQTICRDCHNLTAREAADADDAKRASPGTLRGRRLASGRITRREIARLLRKLETSPPDECGGCRKHVKMAKPSSMVKHVMKCSSFDE